jgi:hypothetical protein
MNTDPETMKPGTMESFEMDRRIAKEVMGWQEQQDVHWFLDVDARLLRCTCDSIDQDGMDDEWFFFHPSTNIAHAWEVAEKLTVWTHYRVGVDMELWTEGGYWKCYFRRRDDYAAKQTPLEMADTAAHAICLAALGVLP